MESPIIDLKNLTKRYGDQTAVNRLNLSIQAGEIYGLLGPNGAGKSTTILMMLGLSEPTSGSVMVCGIDSVRYPIQVKRKVGYLPDDVGFYEDMTGLENLMYTARLNRLSEHEAYKRAKLLLEKVGLTASMNKKAGAYSRGMRQRLGLADVLMKQPQIIILDEPTLGIDPQGVKELLQLIRNLSRDDGITVLLSSHHLHQVQQICDRVGIFVGGNLLASGPIDTLSEQLFGEQREHQRIEFQAAGVSEELLQQIKQLDGVISVDEELDHGANHYVVKTSRFITSEIGKMILEHNAVLHELHPKQVGLDEIYHRYFEGGNSA